MVDRSGRVVETDHLDRLGAVDAEAPDAALAALLLRLGIDDRIEGRPLRPAEEETSRLRGRWNDSGPAPLPEG